MIYIGARIIRQGLDLTERTWAEFIRNAWMEVGEYWYARLMDKHFTHRGATEYDYAPRGHKYEMQKLRRYGHTYPLVFTGDAKFNCHRIRDVRATSTGARVRLYVEGGRNSIPGRSSRYFYQYRGAGPNKVGEMMTISQPEADLLSEVLTRSIIEQAAEAEREDTRTEVLATAGAA